MKIVFENVVAESHTFLQFLDDLCQRGEQGVRFSDLSIQADHGEYCEIAVDVDPFPDDFTMRVLTSLFECSDLVVSVPAMPGLRWVYASSP